MSQQTVFDQFERTDLHVSLPHQQCDYILTPEQQAVVAHDHGPALVFAVAGAGKTTAMVHRIERLVREEVFAPQRIMATSFSRATVGELRDRLEQWEHCRRVRPMTLHGLCWRVMKQQQEQGKLPERFELPNSEENNARIFYQALKAARQQRSEFGDLESIQLEDFLDWVGTCKSNLQYADLKAAELPENALALAGQAVSPKGLPDYLPLYKLFEKVRLELGILTFDDLLLSCWEAFVSDEALLARWQTSYDCILVDEFQDICLAQSEILDLLAAGHRNYMAIGDDDQTIYEWRGASPRFILDFPQRYSADRYQLTDNFRCRASQVILANGVIALNEKRWPKRLQLTQGFAGHTRAHECKDGAAMGEQVVAAIENALKDNVPPSEIAVLVRTYAQTPYIERMLIEKNIPYHLPDGRQFFDRPEIRDLLSYVALARFDAERSAGEAETDLDAWTGHWQRVRNRPGRYLSNMLSQEILKAMHRDGSLSQALRKVGGICEDYLGDRLRDWANIHDWLIGCWQQQEDGASVLRGLEKKLGWCDWLESSSASTETGRERAENVRAFLAFAADLGRIGPLLDQLRDLANQQRRTRMDAGQAVILTSIHRAKGLEWHTVLVPGLNDGIFPPPRSEDLEAERRLLYVALTRTRQHLELFYAADNPVSPFLRQAGFESLLTRGQRLADLMNMPAEQWDWKEIQCLFQLVPPLGLSRYYQRWHAFEPGLKRRIQGVLNLMGERELWHRTRLDPDLLAIFCPEPADREASLSVDEIAGFDAFFLPPEAALEPGQIRHARYGIGTVLKSNIGKNGDMLQIRFPGKGKMQLPADDPELNLDQ